MIDTKHRVRTDPIFVLLCAGGLALFLSLFLPWLTYVHVACYNVCSQDQTQSLNLIQVLSPGFHDQLSPGATSLINNAYFPTLDLLFFSGFLGIVAMIMRSQKIQAKFSHLTVAQRRREGIALWERKSIALGVTVLSCIATVAAFVNIQTHTNFLDTFYNSSQIILPSVIVSGVTVFLLGSAIISFACVYESYREWQQRQKGSPVQS